MTDPSTPVPSDEAVEAAARILAREYGYDHVWENDVGEEVYDRHYWDRIGKTALTAAYAIDGPRIAAEAAAEARAATLREVYARLQAAGHTEAAGVLHLLFAAHFNPEANNA